MFREPELTAIGFAVHKGRGASFREAGSSRVVDSGFRGSKDEWIGFRV